MDNYLNIPGEIIDHLIDLALKEDIGTGDVTTKILVPARLKAKAIILAKTEGRLAGIEIARKVFLKLDPRMQFRVLIRDGSPLKPGDTIAELQGNARAILTGERTALNFLQRLSGIATQASQFVARVQDLPVRIIDTRKTTPGYRLLEKYAVRMGGAHNHRLNLSDGILIKDNHLTLTAHQGNDARRCCEKEHGKKHRADSK